MNAGDDRKKRWESAYRDYESSDQKIRKFKRRFELMDIDVVGKTVLDAFCGSGESGAALAELGCTRVIQLDLSEELLGSRYVERGICADSARLPILDRSIDIVTVQGGLHHLPDLETMSACFEEIGRVLKDGGRFAFVEPHMTFRLRLFLALVMSPLAGLSKTLGSIRYMVEDERVEYFHWLENWRGVRSRLEDRFRIDEQFNDWHSVFVMATKVN